jgi:hypothetical protein
MCFHGIGTALSLVLLMTMCVLASVAIIDEDYLLHANGS